MKKIRLNDYVFCNYYPEWGLLKVVKIHRWTWYKPFRRTYKVVSAEIEKGHFPHGYYWLDRCDLVKREVKEGDNIELTYLPNPKNLKRQFT